MSGRPDLRSLVTNWPVYRQLTGRDRLGRGDAVRSPHTEHAAPRTEAADRVVPSVCPYCAVGCGQRVYVAKVNGKDTVTQIEGDPDSPVSRGRLCPKGSASKELVTHPGRLTRVLYRRPYGTSWEPLALDQAMDMIADRVLATRAATWQETLDGKEQVTQIEGDPDSPVSRGRLCPKGAASKQLVTHAGRQTKVLYRRPFGTAWESLGLDEAMDMIAERVLATRSATWQDQLDGEPVQRTMGFASLGGATLDNEENYLIKKLWTALGAIQIENQARI